LPLKSELNNQVRIINPLQPEHKKEKYLTFSPVDIKTNAKNSFIIKREKKTAAIIITDTLQRGFLSMLNLANEKCHFVFNLSRVSVPYGALFVSLK